MFDVSKLANPLEFYMHDAESGLFRLTFCSGTIECYVWARGADDAFEIAVDWCDDQGYIGAFTFLNQDDLRVAAEELGITYDPTRSLADQNMDDDTYYQIVEHAEIDLTIIGHTTLDCERADPHRGKAYVASWEWTIDDASAEEHAAAWAASNAAYEAEFGETYQGAEARVR